MKFYISRLLSFLVLLPADNVAASEAICKSFVNGVSSDEDAPQVTLQSFCDSFAINKCCQGKDACTGLSANARYTFCQGCCNGESACNLLAQNAPHGAEIVINKNACSFDGQSCQGLAQDSTALKSLIVKEYSCLGNKACTQLAGNIVGLVDLIVETDACIGQEVCQDAFRAADALKSLTIPEGSCTNDKVCFEEDMMGDLEEPEKFEAAGPTSPSKGPKTPKASKSAKSAAPSDVPSHIPSMLPSDLPSLVPSSEPTGFPSIGFDLQNCDSYSRVWLFDLESTCDPYYRTCQCTDAQRLINEGKIDCETASCPEDCALCDFCLQDVIPNCIPR
ncbi:hypothetical protein CTEN210_12663 [Chaetoceros tenuissimus]|uniref:Uncharacterized protein n=1 Tax=Chaetoceros tenuissimus TaxID=426638 RepID=A0AAD3D1L6_9STRA|nr:hypothetical protein CTEN210_12663 [Chaetoceros tenuissimus]